MAFRAFVALLLALFVCEPVLAQVDPTAGAPAAAGDQRYEILGLSVEGVGTPELADFVKQSSSLTVGQQVLIPGDPALAEAIRSVYRLNMFSDVKIVVERTLGTGVYLALRVTEEPKLGDFTFEGVRRGWRDDLKKEIPLVKGGTVTPADLERAKLAIREFYRKKGFLLAEVDVARRPITPGNTMDLAFTVRPGEKVEIGDIVFHGNNEISDRRLRKRMKDTKRQVWWRFWSRPTFKRDKYEQDVQNVVDYYNQKGYFDAQIVSDSVYLRDEERDPELVVELTLREGPRYHVRRIEWEGNTVVPDEALTGALGFERGDAFNSKKLEENLYGNRQNSDVTSLYTNRGYMRFNAQPTIRVAPGDSLDIVFDVYEGDIYNFGRIEIAGNNKTKEHVIRRELYTVPGQTFSRESLQESIRRLGQLGYFNQEALATGIATDINEEEKTVDLTYKLEEVGSDQLELSGTWGRFGLVLMLRFGFNNFSAQNFFKKEAWRPLPSGDGQKLSLGIQTNGRYYQNYSVSFTEPWFRGRPTPIGFALSHSRLERLPSYYSISTPTSEDSKFITTSARFFLDRRLKWPDEYFNTSSSVGYQYYLNKNDLYPNLPSGVSQEITLSQNLTRSSLDNPMFPMRGSSLLLSLQVAPPIPGFIQYHKWRFQTGWNVPIINKVSLGVSSDFGYIGSLTGEKVAFERFDVGGSPFETQGYYVYGTDVVYMRGYPRSAIGPRQNGEAVGGTILNKFTSELRWLAVQTPQLSAAPYLFTDAANTWNDTRSYNPSQLYRSAGMGVRLFLPIVGMLEMTYGYNFDEFVPITSGHQGDRRWYFQFSLGQGFGQ